MNSKRIFSARALRIPDYPLAVAYSDPNCVLLGANESAYEPFPEAIEAAQQVLRLSNRYPDPSYHLLRDALAAHYSVGVEHIVTGNGSCDLLLAIGDALLTQDDELAYGWPSFSVYPHLAQASGASAKAIALRGDTYDLAAIGAAITPATKLVIICNPNNPTSTAVPQAALCNWVRNDVPRDVIVVIDEAYYEYNDLDDDPTLTLQLARQQENVVLLRTFSKAFGLAALRVGYAICGSLDLARALIRVRQPFVTNAAALAAATASLGCQEQLQLRVRQTQTDRKKLTNSLQERGLSVATSRANFCWVTLPQGCDDQSVVTELFKRNVLVRGGTSLGLAGSLRVSCGTEGETAAFLTAFDDVLKVLTC